MATDDLAAEIAAHRQTKRVAGMTPYCFRCYEYWPCLVRRLADVLAASEARAERLSELKERALDLADVVAHHLIGGDPEERFVARDAARSLISLADQHDREPRAVPAAEPDAGGDDDG